MPSKTNLGLVAWSTSKIGAGYVYGTYFGKIIDMALLDAKRIQYASRYNKVMSDGRTYYQHSEKWIGHEAGDCVGLIKGYYWFDPARNRVIYGFEGRPDVSANGMYYAGQRLNGKTSAQNFGVTWGNLSTIAEVPGILVWHNGHIGVYIGDGWVIESRGVDYGVVKTRLSGRPWTNWVMCPYIDYTEEGEEVLKQGEKGQAVYSYQIICKRLGCAVGSFDDFALKDNTGSPLKTGCDGSYGPVMLKVTNDLQRLYGLPVTADGLVSDALYGKLNHELQLLEYGVSVDEHNALVAAYKQQIDQIASLQKDNGELTQTVEDYAKDIVNKANIIQDKNKVIAGVKAAVKTLFDLL